MLPTLTPAVRALMIVNVGVFFVNMLASGALAEWFGVSMRGLLDGFGLGVLRLVTYQFVHDYYSVWHVVMNMLVLYFFGTWVEAEVGKRGLVRLYLAAGVAGGVLQLVLFSMFLSADAVTVGASGACYGIMVYAACMAPTSTVLFFGIFPIQLRWLVGILVFAGLYETILTMQGQLPASGVAEGAHLGGALFGWLAFRHLRTYFMTSDFRPGFWGNLGGRWRSWREAQRRNERAQRQATLDSVLDKVHREGMGALTTAERRVLERASKDAKRR